MAASDWITIQLRIHRDTHARLAQEAAESGLSVTSVVSAYCEHAIGQGWKVQRPAVTRPSVTEPGTEKAGT